MNTPKHTPGPWTTSREDIRGVYASGGAALVATLHTCSLPEAGAVERMDVTRANAVLVAAAPDLLAEVIQVAEELESLASRVQHVGAAGRKGERLNPSAVVAAAAGFGLAARLRAVARKATEGGAA